MTIFAETERLVLREVLESDLDGMFELDTNPEVHKYLGNKPITTKKQAEEAIMSIRKQYKERGIGRFATIEKSSGDFIGWSGLKFNTGDDEVLGDKHDFYDIGYRFIPRYWGKGYATEAAIASLDFGINQLQLKTIFGAAETGNRASNKILEKIGLKFIEVFPYENVLINWYKLEHDEYT